VQGECKSKSKAQDLLPAPPSRSLLYLKVVQGECKTGSKAQDLLPAPPSRSLLYLKVVQGETSTITLVIYSHDLRLDRKPSLRLSLLEKLSADFSQKARSFSFFSRDFSLFIAYVLINADYEY